MTEVLRTPGIFTIRIGERSAELIPGVGPLDTIDDAAHFLQKGEEVGHRMATWLQSLE